MENAILAVKAEILEIINAANTGGTTPTTYIIGAYGGYFGPFVNLTITEDTEVVKALLNGLTAYDGQEVTFHALQVLCYVLVYALYRLENMLFAF